MFPAMRKVYFGIDDDDKKEKAKKCLREDIPKILTYMEKLLEQKGTTYFVGNKVKMNW
jgi:glutathione S-transferase